MALCFLTGAAAVKRAMMQPAERGGELIAHATAKRRGLRSAFLAQEPDAPRWGRVLGEGRYAPDLAVAAAAQKALNR